MDPRSEAVFVGIFRGRVQSADDVGPSHGAGLHAHFKRVETHAKSEDAVPEKRRLVVKSVFLRDS